MNDKYGRFLPVGTVVLLKGAKKRLMITGFCSFDEGKRDKAYDYTGCLYPEGIISSKQMALFNHDQIEKIFHLGLQDEEEKVFKQRLAVELNELIRKQQEKVQNKGNNEGNNNL